MNDASAKLPRAHLNLFSESLYDLLYAIGKESCAEEWFIEMGFWGPGLSDRLRAGGNLEDLQILIVDMAGKDSLTSIQPWKQHPNDVMSGATAHACAASFLFRIFWLTLEGLPVFEGLDSLKYDLPKWVRENLEALKGRLAPLMDGIDGVALRQLAERVEWERLKVVLNTSTEQPPAMPLTPLQSRIIEHLDGCAMGVEALAAKVSGGDTSRLYKPGALKELREAGRVAHRHSVGYFRPDSPPPKLVPPS